MSNELAILGAAKDVSVALTNFVKTYYTIRNVRKQEMFELDMKIKAFQKITYMREEGIIIRMNIKEIADTQRFIDKQNLTGLALELAMDQLRELNVMLKKNLSNFQG